MRQLIVLANWFRKQADRLSNLKIEFQKPGVEKVLTLFDRLQGDIGAFKKGLDNLTTTANDVHMYGSVTRTRRGIYNTRPED